MSGEIEKSKKEDILLQLEVSWTLLPCEPASLSGVGKGESSLLYASTPTRSQPEVRWQWCDSETKNSDHDHDQDNTADHLVGCNLKWLT